MSFLLSLIFPLQQNWRTRGQNKFCPEEGRKGVGKEVALTMYIHVSKYKHDKLKKIKKDMVLRSFCPGLA
jgi:hypothetical protein